MHPGLLPLLHELQPDLIHVVLEPWGLAAAQCALFVQRRPDVSLLVHGVRLHLVARLAGPRVPGDPCSIVRHKFGHSRVSVDVPDEDLEVPVRLRGQAVERVSKEGGRRYVGTRMDTSAIHPRLRSAQPSPDVLLTGRHSLGPHRARPGQPGPWAANRRSPLPRQQRLVGYWPGAAWGAVAGRERRTARAIRRRAVSLKRRPTPRGSRPSRESTAKEAPPTPRFLRRLVSQSVKTTFRP